MAERSTAASTVPSIREQIRHVALGAVGLALRAARPHPTSLRATEESVGRPRVLILRPDHLGDALLAGPALTMLRQALPRAHLEGMVGPWAVEVYRRYGAFDQITTCEFPGFTRRPSAHPLAPYRLLLDAARRLRGQAWDAALVLRPDHWWGALLAALAGVPLRIGGDTPATRPLLTHAVEGLAPLHSVRQNLAVARRLVDVVGASPPPRVVEELRFPVAPNEVKRVDGWLREAGVEPGAPLIAVHPGSGASPKLWPPERWGAVADALADETGATIVLTGTAAEMPLLRAVAEVLARPPLVAAGAFSVGQLAALYHRCRLVVGPDSGPLHLAVAVGTPTVHVFGPTDPRRYGPWGPPDRHRVVRVHLPCSPCGNIVSPPCGFTNAPPCLRLLDTATVLAAARSALAVGPKIAPAPPDC